MINNINENIKDEIIKNNFYENQIIKDHNSKIFIEFIKNSSFEDELHNYNEKFLKK